MKMLETLRQQLSQGEFEFSRHASEGLWSGTSAKRKSGRLELMQRSSKTIPMTNIHQAACFWGSLRMDVLCILQVSYVDSELVKIITLYEPDEIEWIDFSQRRGH